MGADTRPVLCVLAPPAPCDADVLSADTVDCLVQRYHALLPASPPDDALSTCTARSARIMERVRTRVLLEHVLSSSGYGDIHASVSRSRHGKLFAEGGPDFSLAHHGGATAVAVAPPEVSAVGVDVMTRRPVRHAVRSVLARMFRLPDHYVDRLGDAQTLVMWARLEAVVKARGDSLAHVTWAALTPDSDLHRGWHELVGGWDVKATMVGSSIVAVAVPTGTRVEVHTIAASTIDGLAAQLAHTPRVRV